VGAELVDQAVAAIGVAEGEQALGHELDADRRAVVLRQLPGEQRRHPVLAEQVAHRRGGAGLGEKIVDILAQHDRPPKFARAGGGSSRRSPWPTKTGLRSGTFYTARSPQETLRAADSKFLQHLQQARSGTSNRKAALES
jgi:hypothetical protein